MQEECKACDLKQVDKIADIMELEHKTAESLKQNVKEFLKTADMSRTNPEIMGEVFGLICRAAGNEDPYKKIKQEYNQQMLEQYETFQKMAECSGYPLKTALAMAITANLIDFAARHTFDTDTIKKELSEADRGHWAIDDSRLLFTELNQVRQVLYLGDNCGEIVLDKLFCQQLIAHYKTIKITYGVRGKPIVNDVTMADAVQVGMDDIIPVISNGDGGLGTVLEHTSNQFQKLFWQADLVICKGQGNYESLMGIRKKAMYFMFMTKCPIVSEPLNIPVRSIVCMKKR